MRLLSKIIPVAGLFFAALATASVAQAGRDKFFVGGNLSTCEEIEMALQALPAPPPPHVAPFSEILIAAPPSAGTSGDFSNLTQKVRVNMGPTGRTFTWQELPWPNPLDPLEGFDFVAVKAGNGRTVYVYNPDETSDNSALFDLNSTRNITEILFCHDSNLEVVQVTGDNCQLTSAEVQEACNAIENSGNIVGAFQAGSNKIQLCACPGVAAVKCDPKDLCDPGDLYGGTPPLNSIPDCDPLGGVNTNFCNPDFPADGTERCCALNSAGNIILKKAGAAGLAIAPGLGSWTTETSTGSANTIWENSNLYTDPLGVQCPFDQILPTGFCP